MKRSDTILSVLFLILLAGMLALSVLGGKSVLATLRSEWQNHTDAADSSLLAKAEFVTDHGESALNKVLDRPHFFIELYGAVQRITGQRMVEDTTADTSVVKLNNGSLTFCGLNSAYIDPAENARKTAAFADALAQADIPFLAVTAPIKVADTEKELPEAVHDWGNEIADDFLAELEKNGGAAFDLRPAFDALDNRTDLFFRTDHHWKAEGALFACTVLMDELAQRYGFAVDEKALDEANYDKTVYENYFLGSQGKRVGSLYAGVDDFTVYTPRFATWFRYLVPERNWERTGTFNEALCFSERLAEKDWYGGNPYTYYSGGDYAIATIVNEANPDGPKLVLIRDSFSCALAPFLALQCSELTTIDLRYYSGALQEEVEALSPDLVLLLYAASSTRLENMFAFS